MSREAPEKEKRVRKNYAGDDPSSAAASNPQAAYRARQKVGYPWPAPPQPLPSDVAVSLRTCNR